MVVAGCALVFSGCAGLLAELEQIGTADASTPQDGLREALRVGCGRAVETLSRVDGYMGDAEVRIPVPQKLDKVAKALQTIGAGEYVDEFTI